jgi:hypothetical protein
VIKDRLVCAADLFQRVSQNREQGRVEEAAGRESLVVCRLFLISRVGPQ